MRYSITPLLSLACLATSCTADNPDYEPITPVVRLDGGNVVPGVPFQPSHISGDWFAKGTAPLTITTSIDTGAFTIDGKPAPSGVFFGDVQGLGVLAALDVVVPAHSSVRVHGTRPLLVIASAGITIAGDLDGGAHLGEPGPGGASSDNGAGAGRRGSGSPLDSGGSGAGFGDRGGAAGAVNGNGCGQGGTPKNGGGATYGDPTLTRLEGGSGGGTGSLGGVGCPLNTDCHGGAGGGAIQLTAGTSLTISGTVNAGGGGGKGGCKSAAQVDSGSGGGGGSGGAVLLESPLIQVGGFVAANGGGGGGGAFYTVGGIGGDGSASIEVAPGGAGGMSAPMGGMEVTQQRGGLGSSGGPGGDSMTAGNCGNSGGGGGGSGRIYMRTRGAFSQAKSFSPTPIVGTL